MDTLTLSSVAAHALVWALLSAIVGVAAEREVISPAGVECIVIPTTATDAESHAAAELRTYVLKLTGRDLSVVSEAEARPAGRALVVGRTARNLETHNPDTWPRDTICIGYNATGTDISIIGQGPQGTLFGVYEFLRDQGCRWYMPDNVLAEIVPRRKSLLLAKTPKKHTPSFAERGWAPHMGAPGTWKVHYHPWAVRNGLNTLHPGYFIDYGAKLGHGMEHSGGHSIPTLIPSGNFEKSCETFAAHPEWYPLVNGKRVMRYKDGRPVQVCHSSPQVVQEVARKVITYFSEHRDAYRFSVSHADDPTYWCECDRCIAMDGAESTWRANDIHDAYGPMSKAGPGPMSTRTVRFINKVAKIVGEVHPGKSVSFYAYGTTIAPPRESGWTLETNVIVEFAYAELCFQHAVDDPECPPNALIHEWLRGWAGSGNPIIFYGYPPTAMDYDSPTGVTRSYQSLVAYTTRMGVAGWSGEGQGSWAGSGLWSYLKARMLWDANADVGALIAEFCRDMYGGAAEPMREFYGRFDKALQSLPGHPVWRAFMPALDPAMIDGLSERLAEAERRADSEWAQRNVAMMRVALNSLQLARMEARTREELAAVSTAQFNRIRLATLALVKQYSVPITDHWRDRLSKSPYRPPVEALNGTKVLDLVQGWRFRTDPGDEGRAAGWSGNPPIDTDDWQDIRVDRYWTDQEIDYHGVAWYATTFTVPNDTNGQLWLLFGMIDGNAELWIDGQSVGSLPGDPWDLPKAFRITNRIRPGQPSQLVVRVQKELYAAGLNDGVSITRHHD